MAANEQNTINEKYYCIDTNIILDNPSNIIKLYDNGNILIIPEIVIDELDAKKSGFDEINYNARQFARFLDESEIISKEVVDDLMIIKTKIETLNIEILIVSKTEYQCENTKIALNVLNDRKILEVAKGMQKIYPELKLISLDIMCRTRALSMNIKSETLKGKDEKLSFEFHKTITVPDLKLIKECSSVYDIDPDYKPENYSYTIIDDFTARQKLYSVINERLYEINEATLEKQSVKPINKEQKFFSNAILEDRFDVLVVDAKAGSGKTLLSLSAAMRLVALKKYSRIIYIRNSIESVDKGEDIGYLPGLESKFEIYNHPLMDSLRYIVKNDIKKSKANTAKSKQDKDVNDENTINEKIQEYIKQYGIETCWPGEARGRTFSDAIIIMDEVQNMSAKTAHLISSRIDKTCKLIAVGSNKQIDNMYTNKYINGLSKFLNASKKTHSEVSMFAGELNKVIRGPITEWAERIFDEK